MNGEWRVDSTGAGLVYLPVGIPKPFQTLIDEAPSPAAAAALSRQIVPSADEKEFSPGETADPLGEARHCVTPRLVHQYPNRVLLLTTGTCLGYCRYCFRRTFTGRGIGFIGGEELVEVQNYLVSTPAVQEILVSGGDPLSGTDEELSTLLSEIRRVRPDILIRLCTRANVFAPERFSDALVSRLRGLRPLWVIPHINHPAELGPAQVASLMKLVDSGISVQSQTVLLRGVNDSAATLADLFHRLTCLGIKPGYLFQCDLALGVASFRVPLADGLSLWKSLRERLSGLSLPEYAVDLPGGGGKFPLSVPALMDSIVDSGTSGTLAVRGSDGKVYTYPAL